MLVRDPWACFFERVGKNFHACGANEENDAMVLSKKDAKEQLLGNDKANRRQKKEKEFHDFRSVCF